MVALARRISVILHRMWVDDTDFLSYDAELLLLLLLELLLLLSRLQEGLRMSAAARRRRVPTATSRRHQMIRVGAAIGVLLLSVVRRRDNEGAAGAHLSLHGVRIKLLLLLVVAHGGGGGGRTTADAN